MKKLIIMLENELLTSRSDPVPRGRQKQFPISVILVCCATLFLRPTSSLADFSRGSTVNWIWATPGIYSINYLASGFAKVQAIAYDSKVGTYTANGPASMPYPGTYTTPTVTAQGTYFRASAAVSASATSAGHWSATASPFGVSTIGPKTKGETAWVKKSVVDPLSLNVSPGEPITVSFVPSSGLGITLSDADPSVVYSSTYSASAQTDVPGLASLFSLSIQMSSDAPGDVGVSFSSNPVLGLNDAAITSELESGFQYDSTTGDYSFDPTGREIDGTFTVPADVSVVNITTGEDDELDASVVPEPSTFALVGIGAVGLAIRHWRRRTAKA